MSIYDFLDLFCYTEDIEVYSLDKEETVWEGDAGELPARIGYKFVESVDWPSGPKMTINIE